ncbi:MAG: hypothetical protein GY749_44995 [Desulfobacteraceae bacterium]|nr:hypothetical protein [Desulfobacteraceae bacterium]
MKWLLRKLYCWKHKIALDQQCIAINKHYKKDSAYTVGKPIYQGQAGARDIFDSYFQNYHFHKNFFANYHAVWKLFCSGTKTVIPENFFVYDIACGPYTATLSLLQFFQNEKTLKRQAFFLNLCDMGNFALEKLYQANSHIQQTLTFPVPLENECKEFQPGKWEICTRNCYHENMYGCRLLNNIQDTRADIVFDDKNSMNLIFCSYAGISYNIKFIDCITGF